MKREEHLNNGVNTEAPNEEEVSKENTENAKIKALEDEIAQLKQLLLGTLPGAHSASSNTSDHIKIVHLVNRADGLCTLISLSNLEIALRYFGEERSLSTQQFEELVGKYRSWFNLGILAVHGDYEDKASHYGLNTAAHYPINSGFYAELGSKTMAEIEDIYPRLPEAGKDSLISYWVRKARQGENKFADIRKLETLNRLSDGALTQLISELNAKNNK